MVAAAATAINHQAEGGHDDIAGSQSCVVHESAEWSGADGGRCGFDRLFTGHG
jgi:hypothetical protein